MLKQTSSKFKTFFLIQFTKELIKNNGTSYFFELEEILKKRTAKKKIQDIVYSTQEKTIRPTQTKSLFPQTPRSIPKQLSSAVLTIPPTRFPQRLQYLKPVPTQVKIDLGKLSQLIKDPGVKSIECNGANTNIIVKGSMGMKNTNIILNKEEIENIIKKFSEATKIPMQEGIFRVAIGRLIFSAIISEIVSSKFIIKKMIPQIKSPPRYPY